jgi:hypothetical protein
MSEQADVAGGEQSGSLKHAYAGIEEDIGMTPIRSRKRSIKFGFKGMSSFPRGSWCVERSCD